MACHSDGANCLRDPSTIDAIQGSIDAIRDAPVEKSRR
jgi:hypothetical protein